MTLKYKLVECENGFHDDHWCVEILEDELEGFVFQYDTINLKENDDGEAVLDFNTVTVNNPNDVDLDCCNVEAILGDVLVDIIEKRFEEEELNERTASDTKESDT